MRNRVKTALVGALILGLTLGGCATSGSGIGSDPNNPNQVEVFTWWSSGSEKLGLDALVRVFYNEHPNIQFINAAVQGGAGSNAKKALEFRLKAKNPPDTFQAHAGAELTDYIKAHELQDLSGFYKENGLDKVFPATLLDRLTVDGKIYSVPSNIHRANVVWANVKVLTAAGIDPNSPPADLDGWIAQLQQLKDGGMEAPLALATDWTQVQLFENCLIADLGAKDYSGLWDGSTKWDDPRVDTAVNHFNQLISFTNKDAGSLEWDDATQLVVVGTSAYQVMGDWAEAHFTEDGQAYGTDYTTFPTPGTQGVFDFLADSFTLPVGAPHQDAAKTWLKVISSANGQKAFSLAKGSIPARTDTVASDYPAYQQTAIKSFGQDQIVSSLAHGAAAKVAWLTDITSAVAGFVKDHKTGPFESGLTDAAATALG